MSRTLFLHIRLLSLLHKYFRRLREVEVVFHCTQRILVELRHFRRSPLLSSIVLFHCTMFR